MRHLCGVEELGGALFVDDIDQHSMGDAGNEVAYVLSTGERRHGPAVGLVGVHEGGDPVLFAGQGGLIGSLSRIVTADDCEIDRFGNGCFFWDRF